MNRQRLFKQWIIAIVVAGAAAVLLSIYRLPTANLDWRYLALVVTTLVVASRLSIKIPHVNGEITVADAMIFLTLLLYGGEAAVLLAAAEGICSSLRVSKKRGSSFLTRDRWHVRRS